MDIRKSSARWPYSAAVLATSPPPTPLPAGAAQRWRGAAPAGLLETQSRRGRRRRWVYAAAGDEDVVVGAAVVHVGVLGLGTAFAFASTPTRTWTWDAGPGRAGDVGGLTGHATVQRDDARIAITPTRLELEVPVDGGRVSAGVDLAPASPVTLVTATPRGGWNATTKAAGHAGTGTVQLPNGTHELTGMGWSDSTDGRQDARTRWRWAAGAGRSTDGHHVVGLQASTGMNALGPGEDLVWWDGAPVPLDVHHLAPVAQGAFRGVWRLAGDDWEVRLTPWGVRAADEGLGPIRSRYVQPVGRWQGTLPGPDGTPVDVVMRGVAEDHEARW